MDIKQLRKDKDWSIALLPIGFIVMIVIPEILIFGFDQEARDDWTRMLPVAVFAPFFWSMAISALGTGIYMLWESFKDKDMREMLFFSLALIYPGVRVPYYWIKRIVIDDVPAFGYNPDNIYAVAGLNTIALGILWAVEGAIAGLLLYGFVWGLRRLLRKKNLTL